MTEVHIVEAINEMREESERRYKKAVREKVEFIAKVHDSIVQLQAQLDKARRELSELTPEPFNVADIFK